MSDAKIFFVTVIGEPLSPERERSDDLLRFVLTPAAQEHGASVKRADLALVPGPTRPDTTPGPILDRLMRDLFEATVVICDLTGRNPNVFYELGLAHATGAKVILLVDSVSSLPFDVRNENVITIGQGTIGAKQAESLARVLADTLGEVLAQEYIPRSSVTEFLPSEVHFPPTLREAYRRAQGVLFKRDQRYRFKVLELVESHLQVELTLSYVLFNPTDHIGLARPSMTPVRPAKFLEARLGDEDVDLEDPEIRSERGLVVPTEVPPRSQLEVLLRALVTYRFPDSDVFLTYIPSEDYELRIEHPSEARFVAKSLLNGPAARSSPSPGTIVYTARGGVTGFQGIKLDWMAREA